MSQLAHYVRKFGKIIEVGRRAFTIEGFGEDGATKVATFKGTRSINTGIVSVNATVPGMPGAEVWTILNGRDVIARFAVHDNAIKALA